MGQGSAWGSTWERREVGNLLASAPGGAGEVREREWVSAGIGLHVIPHRAARCVATAYVCTLTGIPSATTSGSMPTPLTFTPLAGSRRLDTSCSPPKVRPRWVGHSEAVALRPVPSFHWSPLSPMHTQPLFVTSCYDSAPWLLFFPCPLSVHPGHVLLWQGVPGPVSEGCGVLRPARSAASVWGALAASQPRSAWHSVHPPPRPAP